MRLISQDRATEMPYEQTILQLTAGNGGDVLVRGKLPGDSWLTLASYASTREAIDALKTLHSLYLHESKPLPGKAPVGIFFFPA
jgi:hypothetical protein